MRAVVVFESMFGNTQRIAQAVAEGLESQFVTEIVEVGSASATLDGEIGLLVVGGPTHAFGLSRPSTRQTATEQASGALVSRGIGVREWLAALPTPPPAVAAAAFDTHLDKPRWLPGSAARETAKRLRRRGYRVVAPPASFYVASTTGPLVAGEIERARRWGETISAAVVNRGRQVT